MPIKPNDFLVASTMQDESGKALTMEDLTAAGLTPDNTVLLSKEEYKNNKWVQRTFVKEGTDEFDEKGFDAYHDSLSRVYNDWSKEKYFEKAVNLIDRSPLDWTNLNAKKYNPEAVVHQINMPNKTTLGLSNIWEVGTPTFSDAEIAQSKNVLDENGNELDYSPNDARGGFFKGIFRDPMALAIWEEDGVHTENGIQVKHKKGDIYRDEDGDARYQILGNKSSAGRQMLNYWDTVTVEGSWLNDLDFMDSDGMRKSLGGVAMKAAFQVAPYFIPYVGPIYKWFMAAKELSTAMPMLLNSVNTAFSGTDENEFGKAMNAWSNRMLSWKPGMTQHGNNNFFSAESIGNMFSSSIGQLYQQRAIGEISKLLKANGTVGKHASITYMALTSGQDTYNSFKEAGASDQVAGIGSLVSMGVLYGLFSTPAVYDWMTKGTWLDEDRVIKDVIKKSGEVAREAAKFEQLPAKLTKMQSTALYQKMYKPVKEFLEPILKPSGKALRDTFARSINEGIEETVEEMSMDFVKGLSLALEGMGVDMTGLDEELNFGFTPESVLTRYGGAFIGGAIGGGVFEGVESIESKITGQARLNDLKTNQQILWLVANNRTSDLLHEAKKQAEAGEYGSRNLSVKGRVVTDAEGKEKFVFNSANGNDNQNNYIYQQVVNKIKAAEHFLTSHRFKLSDEELLTKILNLETDKKSAEEYAKKLSSPVIDKIISLGLMDAGVEDTRYLMARMFDLQQRIERRKNELFKSIPDGSDKDSAIKTDAIVKNLEEEYKEIEKVVDEILKGEHADYYIELGLFLADKDLSKKFSDSGVALSEVANYYWSKTGEQFDKLSKEDKQKVIDEYNQFKALTDFDSSRERFNIFRAVNERYADTITKSVELLEDYKVDPNFANDIHGDNVGKIINGWKSRKQALESLLETEPENEEHLAELARTNYNIEFFEKLQTSRLLDRIKIGHQFFQFSEKDAELQKEIDELAAKMATDASISLDDEIAQKFLEKESLGQLSKQYVMDAIANASKNKVIMENLTDLVRDSVQVFVNKYDSSVGTELINSVIGINIKDYTDLLSRIVADPLNAESEIRALARKIYNDFVSDNGSDMTYDAEGNMHQVTEDEYYNGIVNAGGILSEILELVNTANEYQRNLPKAPIEQILKDLYVEIDGGNLNILDLYELEKSRFISTNDVDKYVLNSDNTAEEIDKALSLLNVLESVLDASNNGYNIEANKFRIGDGKLKLAELPNNVAEFYKKEIDTLRNRLNYLKSLSEQNNSSQAKRQQEIMLHVEPMFVKSIYDKRDKLTSVFGIDVEEMYARHFSDVGGKITIDNHEQFKDAKIAFEKELHDEIHKKGFSQEQIVEKLFEVFADEENLWTCDSGKFTDTIEKFPPYVEFLNLANIISSSTYQFSVEYNEKVLQSDEYRKYTPFYAQEFANRCIWAQMVNPAFFEKITEKLKKQSENHDDDYIKNLFEGSHIIYVTGGPGTGKSSAVGLAAKLMAEGRGGKVIGVVKFEKQAESLRENLQVKEHEVILFNQYEKETTDATDLYETTKENKAPYHTRNLKNVDVKPLSAFDGVTGPKILIFDEFTFYDEAEIQLMVKQARENNYLIIGLGDPKQNQAVVDSRQTGPEDGVIMTTPALTVSMRVTNKAMDVNTKTLDSILSDCEEFVKSHRDLSVIEKVKELDDARLLPKQITLDYNDENDDLFGTKIEEKGETVNQVKEWINKLAVDGKTVGIITDRTDLDSFENKDKGIYKIDPLAVQGSEFDYVIIVKDWNTNKLGNPNDAYLLYKDLLTMISRAKNGSVIIKTDKSTALENTVLVKSASSAGGKIIINSDKDTRFQNINAEYREYIEKIYAKYVSDSEPGEDGGKDDDPESSPGEIPPPPAPGTIPGSDEILDPAKEKDVVEKVINAYNNPNLTDEEKGFVREKDYRTYQDRQMKKHNTPGGISDMEDYVELLYGDINLQNMPGSLLHNIPDGSEEFINQYKKYLQIISATVIYSGQKGKSPIQSNAKHDDSWDVIVTEGLNKAKSQFKDPDAEINEFHDKVQNLLIGEHYFNVTQIDNSDKFMIWISTTDGSLQLPIAVATNITPGLYEEIYFDELYSVVGLSSNGHMHKPIHEVGDHSIFMSETGATYAPTEEVRSRYESDVHRNEGKPQFYISYKPWLQPGAVYQFANIGDGKYWQWKYKDDIKVIDIQKRISLDAFIALCKAKQHILGRHGGTDPNPDSSSDKDPAREQSIKLLKEYLQLTSKDSDYILSKPTDSDKEREWRREVPKITQILTDQSLSHLQSVLISYFLEKDNTTVLSNLMKWGKSSGGFAGTISPENWYEYGFSLKIYKDSNRGPHSEWTEFFFKFDSGTNSYKVWKSSKEEGFDADWELLDVTIDSNTAPSMFESTFSISGISEFISAIKDHLNPESRLVKSGEDVKTAISKNDLSINLGLKKETYGEPIIGSPSVHNHLIEGQTRFIGIRDTDVVFKLLDGIDIKKEYSDDSSYVDYNELETYLINNSMFKNNFYVATRGLEYYHMNGLEPNLLLSAHKKIELDGFESDYVKFIAPLFGVTTDYRKQINDPEILKRFNLKSEMASADSTNVLYVESNIKLIGDKNKIFVEHGGKTYPAQVISKVDNKMWVKCPAVKGLLKFEGDFVNNCPDCDVNLTYHFTHGNDHFFKENLMIYKSYNEITGKWSSWMITESGLFDYKTFISFDSVGVKNDNNWYTKSNDLKINYDTGEIISGSLTILNGAKTSNVEKFNFAENTILMDGEWILFPNLTITFDLSSFNYVSESKNNFIDQLTEISKKSPIFKIPKSIINILSGDVSRNIDIINMYLRGSLVDIGYNASLKFENGKLGYSITDSTEATIIRTLKENGKNISSVSSYGSDGPIETCNHIEFLVTLQDGSELKGELNRNGKKWSVKYNDDQNKTPLKDMILSVSDSEARSVLVEIYEELNALGESVTYNTLVASGKYENDPVISKILDEIDNRLMNNCDFK